MKYILILLLFTFNTLVYAKEWKNLKTYQKTTQKTELPLTDWLKRDRLKNTNVWQMANRYNLENNLPEEYTRIDERKDFYEWFYKTLQNKGHEVVWVTMAHFISKKLRLMEVFPYSIFSNKNILNYANQGSKDVFNKAFNVLRTFFLNDVVLTGEKALEWDKTILYEEQYFWVGDIYKTIDTRTLKKVERIAKGRFLYGLVVPKQVRFKGDISNAAIRYNYAIEALRPYCEKAYK